MNVPIKVRELHHLFIQDVLTRDDYEFPQNFNSTLCLQLPCFVNYIKSSSTLFSQIFLSHLNFKRNYILKETARVEGQNWLEVCLRYGSDQFYTLPVVSQTAVFSFPCHWKQGDLFHPLGLTVFKGKMEDCTGENSCWGTNVPRALCGGGQFCPRQPSPPVKCLLPPIKSKIGHGFQRQKESMSSCQFIFRKENMRRTEKGQGKRDWNRADPGNQAGRVAMS